MFAVPPSSGTVAAITVRAAGKFYGFLQHARDQIIASEVTGFDETGFRVEGRLDTGCTAPAPASTRCSTVDPKRGTKAMEAITSLPSFAGRHRARRLGSVRHGHRP